MNLTALKALSLAINLSHNDPTLVAHLRGWTDYAWTEVQVGTAPPRLQWDWHRPQWVDFGFAYSAGSDSTKLTVTLINDDPTDDDFVCVTAAFLTADKAVALVFHQNVHVDAGSTVSHQYDMPTLGRWASIKSVAIGSKQCRLGAHEDDAVYAASLRDLGEEAAR